MSDDEKKTPEPIPELTMSDVAIVQQLMAQLTILGVVQFHVHPCRFPLLWHGLMRAQGRDADTLVVGDLADEVVPLGVHGPNGTLEAHVLQFSPCKEGCLSCEALLTNGPNYPVPPERKKLWTPS